MDSDKTLTYAIGDLHGRYDLFQLAVAEITKRGGGKVVFLGDYVDRGPQSAQIITALMAGPPKGQTWVCLKGNHEDMMVQAIENSIPDSDWVHNGGRATLRSYGPLENYETAVPASHYLWLKALPLYHATQHHFFVHAGADETKKISDQIEIMLLWARVKKNYNYSVEGKHVVHGHTPFPDGPILLPSRTNLDTYAYDTGILHLGVFDESVNDGPVDIIRITNQ